VLDLRVLLGQHVARYPYQRALSREGAVRLDLDGNPVGAVTEEQRERALRPLRRSGPGTVAERKEREKAAKAAKAAKARDGK
jgi:sRNA-binding protein